MDISQMGRYLQRTHLSPQYTSYTNELRLLQNKHQ